MKKRSNSRKLLLSKETVRTLVPSDMNFVAGGWCRKISFGVGSACDCSGSATDTGTCTDCSTIQY